jgi:hypothetical protein
VSWNGTRSSAALRPSRYTARHGRSLRYRRGNRSHRRSGSEIGPQCGGTPRRSAANLLSRDRQGASRNFATYRTPAPKRLKSGTAGREAALKSGAHYLFGLGEPVSALFACFRSARHPLAKADKPAPRYPAPFKNELDRDGLAYSVSCQPWFHFPSNSERAICRALAHDAHSSQKIKRCPSQLVRTLAAGLSTGLLHLRVPFGPKRCGDT